MNINVNQIECTSVVYSVHRKKDFLNILFNQHLSTINSNSKVGFASPDLPMTKPLVILWILTCTGMSELPSIVTCVDNL